MAAREHVIIGTAGHVDHGKTALVKALTGKDADTLAEEKRRGLTIELGFIFLDDPALDKQIVFIDVPGHERFMKTMVAGACTVDAALLVVAADEGISAQTIEHLDILRMLGINSGVIALTKADLVDPERLEALGSEVADFVAGSFLSDAPIIPVSAVTGAGVDEIKSALVSLGRRVRKRRDSGTFRMPIDRVFTIHGFGTVIAGTILAGRVSVGDRIEVFPDGIMAKVRGMQIHDRDVPESYIGRRTALNLQDTRKDDLRRGQCAGTPGTLVPTSRLDARLHLLKNCDDPLKNRARVRLYIGTDEVVSRLVLLDCDKLAPGETALAQFVLEAPSVAVPGDRFVIRTLSPLRTIGGGTVLDANPNRHKRFDDKTLEALKKLEGTLADVVEQAFVSSGFVPQSSAEVALSIGEARDAVGEVIESLHASKKLVKTAAGPDRYLHAQAYNELSQRLVDILKSYFAEYPHRLYMPEANLRSQFLELADKQLFDTVMTELSHKGVVYHKQGSRIALAGHQITLDPGDEALAQRIEQDFAQAGFAAPREEEVHHKIDTALDVFDRIMTSLIEQEKLVRLDEKVTYHRQYVQAAEDVITALIAQNGSITVAQLRDKLGVSRKYALALLEYFDNIGLTRRSGDRHVMK